MRTALLLAFAGLATAATAQDDTSGQDLFMQNCASCHGEAADGQGPLAGDLAVAVPALTGLAAANDGEFPLLRVIQTIDGRSGIRGHGGPMPVFGALFRTEFEPLVGSYAAESMVRGRVLQIAEYIESIQQ